MQRILKVQNLQALSYGTSTPKFSVHYYELINLQPGSAEHGFCASANTRWAN
jgi:hypothetical protein